MKKFYLFICIVLLLTSTFPFFAVKASDTDFTVTGQELADAYNDFDGDYIAMNAYRIWSVYKSMGMTDEQAVAAIACVWAECGGKAEKVESVYLIHNDVSKVAGVEMNIEGVPESGTKEYRDFYIENFSQKMDTNPQFRTLLTDSLLINEYKIVDATANIQKAKDNDNVSVSVHSNKLGYNISVSTYYVNGSGYLGCGLYQFTGESLIKLFEWSQKRGKRWFEFENQMAYIIADQATLGGYRPHGVSDYVTGTSDITDLHDLVHAFATGKTIAGVETNNAKVNGNMPASQLKTRYDYADALIKVFQGKDWDKEYGRYVLSLAGLAPYVEEQKGIQDRGIIQSYATAVLDYSTNNGFLLDINNNKTTMLQDTNEIVFKDYIETLKTEGNVTNDHAYSLFELYGEDLHWYRYMGEATYTPGLLDHIWSAVDQDKVSDLISFDTIFYDAYNYLSCQVYPGRPHVLSNEEVENGSVDPRVSTLSGGWFNGYGFTVGSMKLTISKYLVAVITYLAGKEIFDPILYFLDLFEAAEKWSWFKGFVFLMMTISILFFLASIVKKLVGYAKGSDSNSAKDVIERFVLGFLSIALILTLVINPALFNESIKKIIFVVDDLFNEALTDSVQDDEVIALSDEHQDMIIHAAIWRKAIFSPWVKGQFDERSYSELYTQFDGMGEDSSIVYDPPHEKMPQSHADVSTEHLQELMESGGVTTNLNDEQVLYDSATNTGDVYVYVGNGKKIRNWAAYLMSCGSKYHIDSTIDTSIADNIVTDDTALLLFPHFTLKTTAGNIELAADTFRVIDAQMNISPQYFLDGSVKENYKDSHMLNDHYNAYGTVMLFNAAMLIFLLPMIFKRIKHFMLLMITAIKLIYFSIAELFSDSKNTGLHKFVEDLGKNAIGYVIAVIKLNLLIIAYYNLIDEGFIQTILYIIVALFIISFNYQDMIITIRNTKDKAKHAAYTVLNKRER